NRERDRAHAEWKNIHGSTVHGIPEKAAQLAAHLVWIFPIVRRAGAVFRQRANECAIFHASDVALVRAGQVTSRPKLLIEAGQSAGRDHLIAKLVVFFLGAVHPMDVRRTRKLGHFLHPTQQAFIFGERNCRIGLGNGRHWSNSSAERDGGYLPSASDRSLWYRSAVGMENAYGMG